MNPISTKAMTGFKVLVNDEKEGSIAQGDATLTVTQEALIGASDVALDVKETEVSDLSMIELAANLPVPLDAGCRILIQAPRTVNIANVTEVKVHGMFLSRGSVSFSLLTDRNAILITDACLSHLDNSLGLAFFDISHIRNPGYVISSDDFKLTFTDEDENQICSTEGGLSYTTTPGELLIGDFTVTNPLVSGTTAILFEFQPHHQTETKDVQITITLPPEDFTLPSSCELQQSNQFIDSSQIQCKVQGSSFVLTRSFKEPFTNDGENFVQVGLGGIKMPPSERPTGEISIEVAQMVEGTYRLVDRGTVRSKIRAKAGELAMVKVVPALN